MDVGTIGGSQEVVVSCNRTQNGGGEKQYVGGNKQA